jgi:uncharacterized protein
LFLLLFPQIACILHVTTLDRILDGQVRWKTVGEVNGVYLLIVVHTLEEEGEEVVRIISAREAPSHERRENEEGL